MLAYIPYIRIRHGNGPKKHFEDEHSRAAAGYRYCSVWMSCPATSMQRAWILTACQLIHHRACQFHSSATIFWKSLDQGIQNLKREKLRGATTLLALRAPGSSAFEAAQFSHDALNGEFRDDFGLGNVDFHGFPIPPQEVPPCNDRDSPSFSS